MEVPLNHARLRKQTTLGMILGVGDPWHAYPKMWGIKLGCAPGPLLLLLSETGEKTLLPDDQAGVHPGQTQTLVGISPSRPYKISPDILGPRSTSLKGTFSLSL